MPEFLAVNDRNLGVTGKPFRTCKFSCQENSKRQPDVTNPYKFYCHSFQHGAFHVLQLKILSFAKV